MPQEALEDLSRQGMTVEGVESTSDVHLLAERAGLDLPFLELVHRILFEGAPATTVIDCLERLNP